MRVAKNVKWGGLCNNYLNITDDCHDTCRTVVEELQVVIDYPMNPNTKFIQDHFYVFTVKTFPDLVDLICNKLDNPIAPATFNRNECTRSINSTIHSM